MVQKVNILSQHLFTTLLPEHKNNVFFFKIFFCYKVLLDSILLFFLRKSNFNLLKFYLGFSKNFFFFNLYIFKNFSLKKSEKLTLDLKISKRNQFFLDNYVFNKLSKAHFLVANWVPFFPKANSWSNLFLFSKYDFNNQQNLRGKNLKKYFLNKRNLSVTKPYAGEISRLFKTYLFYRIKAKKKKNFFFSKNNYFLHKIFFAKMYSFFFNKKQFLVKKIDDFFLGKDEKVLNMFFVKEKLKYVFFFNKKKRLEVINSNFLKGLYGLKCLYILSSSKNIIFLAFNSIFFFLNKLYNFFFTAKSLLKTNKLSTLLSSKVWDFKSTNYNFFLLRNFSSENYLFLLKIHLQLFLKKKIKLTIFNVFKLLSKFNKFELCLNIILLKKNYYRIMNFFSLKRNKTFMFAFNFIKTLFISLRLKSFGYFLQVICSEVGSSKKQWLIIKKIKKLITESNLFTLNFFGFHILVSGTIQGRLRTTRFHIFKNLSPSIQNVNFEIHYLYRQSFSVYGVLGIKLWVYY